ELCVITQIFAHLLQTAHQLRASEEGNKRSDQTSSRSCDQFCRDFLLNVCHLIGGNRGHAIRCGIRSGRCLRQTQTQGRGSSEYCRSTQKFASFHQRGLRGIVVFIRLVHLRFPSCLCELL